MTRLVVVDESAGANVMAFMDMLRWSEIGPALLAKSDDGYNVLVGSTAAKPLLFAGYADHPNILNRALDSTAAGGYQFIHRTWLDQAQPLCLADFSPINQDRACVRLLQTIGTYDALRAGNFDKALRYASTQWASLPYSKAGQPTHTVAELHAIYAKAGGKG